MAVTDQHVGIALRPLREGANIRTWTGFKHFMYLAEEAVTDWFRDRGTGPSALFRDCGLGLSVTDCSAQLPAVLDGDDLVDAELAGGPGVFTVRLLARRAGRPLVLRARVRVALIREPDAAGSEPPPAGLTALVTGGAPPQPAGEPGPADRQVPPGLRPASVLAPPGSGAFAWPWRVPYYYCQYSRRLAHSGYVRALEEVVDRFLADRGLSIATMLAGPGWIPVVSRARVSVLADAVMEETVYTVIKVTDVFKKLSFDAQVDWYAQRGPVLVHVATGRILHAYAVARGPGAGTLAELDDATIAALTGGRSA